MRLAIFSDLHDNLNAFFTLLDDAARQQVERFVYLGDVGRDQRLFDELQKRQIPCTFGNWEVSGLRHLTGATQQWVANWPATIQSGEALYCHATPDMPPAAGTTAGASRYMQQGITWRGLFPRLHLSEEARWLAFAALEEQNVRVAFHGHTHVQLGWAWEMLADGKRRVRSFAGADQVDLTVGNPQTPNRYLIGVGSVGQPDDGTEGKYVVYDEEMGRVELRRIALKVLETVAETGDGLL